MGYGKLLIEFSKCEFLIYCAAQFTFSQGTGGGGGGEQILFESDRHTSTSTQSSEMFLRNSFKKEPRFCLSFKVNFNPG